MDRLIEENFTKVLSLLQRADCKISDDTYLQLLFSKLSKDESGKKLLEHPACLDFINKTIVERNNSSDASITVFSMQVLALLLADEENFKSLELRNLIETISEIYNIKNTKTSSLQLSYVTLMTSLLNHRSGVQWILEKEFWKDVVHIYQRDRSLYIRREAQKFIISLLDSVRNDKSRSESILLDAFLPLTTKKDVCGSHMTCGEDETDPIILTIDLACAILEATLLNPLPYLLTFLSGFDLEPFVFHLLDHITETNPNHEFTTKLGKFLCLYYFSSINGSSNHSELTILSVKILDLLSSIMKKQSVSSVLAVALYCHSYLCKMKKIVEVSFEDEEGKRLLLRDQLVYIQVTPMLLVSTPTINNELNSNFMSLICETTSSKTQLLAINLKETIKKNSNMLDCAFQSLVSVLQMKDVLDREPAVVVFRAMAFMLWNFAKPDLMESLLMISKSPKLLSTVLDGLRSLIEHFHLTWRDSLETLCLMSFTIEIIQNPNSPSQVVVQSFQLMKRCIEDFIPPNLALLTNSLQNSSLSQLGSLLAKRIHDLNWEVKDSVFEVLECISSISDCKFPVFQEMLVKSNLCELTVKVGVIDSEAYVRASALACLTAMVKVTPLWHEILLSLGVPVIAVTIIQEESEGLVRKEAAGLLTELFRNNRIVNSYKPELYRVMYCVATKELHWEAKMKALEFWRQVAEMKLTDQGMIDGSFPSITFSKADHKIVTLDPPKIKELIQNVLEELSQLGCLRALLVAIKDCDLNVSRCAVSHLSYLRTIAQQNNVISEDIKKQNPQSFTCKGSNMNANGEDYISLLDSILADNKVNHEDHSGKDAFDKDMLYISPKKFLSFLMAVDLDLAMEQRCSWLEQCGSNDVLSLFDDILASQGGSGDGSNVNDMDCY